MSEVATRRVFAGYRLFEQRVDRIEPTNLAFNVVGCFVGGIINDDDSYARSTISWPDNARPEWVSRSSRPGGCVIIAARFLRFLVAATSANAVSFGVDGRTRSLVDAPNAGRARPRWW